MVDIAKADITNLSKDDVNSLYAACESFKRGNGFEIFFTHTFNLYLATTLGLNKIRHDQWVIPISDERFSGGVEMLDFLKKQIIEYSQAKSLSPQPK